MNTFNTEFFSVEIWFIDQAGKAIDINWLDKSKEKQKTKKVEEIYIPPEKRQQIIDDFKLFWVRNVIV